MGARSLFTQTTCELLLFLFFLDFDTVVRFQKIGRTPWLSEVEEDHVAGLVEGLVEAPEEAVLVDVEVAEGQ